MTGVDPPDLAIFIPSLRGGGAERVALRLATRFAGRGLRVDLLLAQAEGPYLRDVPANVRIVDLKARRVFEAVGPIVRYLRENNPPAMLSLLNYANLAALMARRLSGWTGRLVVSERNALQPLFDGKTLRARLFRIAMRFLYPMAANVVVLSESLRAEAMQRLGLKSDLLRIIPNPVDSDAVAIQSVAPPPHPWLADRSIPVIVAVGRFTAAKDYPTLFRAFARLAERRACRMIVLGDGPQRAMLTELAAGLGMTDALAMPGFVDNPISYMAHAEVFVLSSIHEGLPNVMLEAMAAGTKIVSTDCAGSPAEILAQGRWGRLVPVGDVVALGQALSDAIDDPAPPDVKVRAADFDIDHITNAYADVLQIAGHRPVPGVSA